MHLLVLSAFRLKCSAEPIWRRVSMHLLVLSAFRLELETIQQNSTYSVSMHLLVLSAFRLNV